MHILNLSKRNGRAQERMMNAAKVLANLADLDLALVEALTPKSKNPDVRAMQQREAIADLLEALAIGAGAMPATLADEPVVDEPSAPDVTVVTTVESTTQPETIERAPAESGEALPPPVVEEIEESDRTAGGQVSGDKRYVLADEPGEETFTPAATKRMSAGKKKK